MTSLMQTAAVAALLSVGAAALAQAPAVAAKPATTAPAAAAPTTNAAETAVTVNGKNITEGDLEKTLQAGMQGRTMPPAQLEQMRQRYRTQILSMLIDNLLMDEQAAKEKVAITEQDVAKKVEGDLSEYAKLNNMSKEDLAKKILDATKMEYKEYVAKRAADPFLKEMLLKAKLIEKKFPDQIKVSETEVKEYYDKNLEKTYKKPAMVRASHILVKVDSSATADQKAEAKKKIDKVLAEVKKPGSDFAALAKEYSDCPSKANGGDLDFFPRKGAMVEPFAEAAFGLKKGDVSGVVETQFGYHIIKVTDRKDEATMTLSDATAGIREQVQRDKIGKEIQRYSTELRNAAKIVYPKGKEPASQPAMGMGMMGGARPATRPAAGGAARPATPPANAR